MNYNTTIDSDTSYILKQARLEQHLTQEELSQSLHIPIRIIKDIENGTAPKNKILFHNIAKHLGIKL